MADVQKKRSPRAPSVSLEEALERAVRVYEKERRHPAPTDVVAQAIGYKNANNGAALAVLASLRYYGLLERPQEGLLSVSKDVETYQYSPSEEMKRDLLIKWLKTPQVYAELLEKYQGQGALPSDANLRFDLIQRGFNPASAESVIGSFRRSVDFAQYFQALPAQSRKSVDADESIPEARNQATAQGADVSVRPAPAIDAPATADVPSSELDRIPVRLPGGRRAWLLIPQPFFAADKGRLKAQIDLILTDDDESS
jgi:hypothetical protein